MADNKAGTKKLLGTFDVESYISIGDDYMKKMTPDPRYRGKQLQTKPAAAGVSGARTQATLFEPKFLMHLAGEKYVTANRYNVDFENVKAPRTNKLGFLSTDHCKRDEFTNTFRTEQWRQTLHKEAVFTRKASANMYGALPKMTREDPRVTKMLRKMMTSSAQIGAHDFGLKKRALPPIGVQTTTPFARKPIVRSSFYRRTGVFTS